MHFLDLLLQPKNLLRRFDNFNFSLDTKLDASEPVNLLINKKALSFCNYPAAKSKRLFLIAH